MKILKYIVLALILLNIPSIALVEINSTISNLFSIASFLLLILYYILAKKTKLHTWLIIFGLLYFSLSSISGQAYFPKEDKDFYVFVIKYFIIIICGNELIKNLSIKELFWFLSIGALSIILQIIFFYNPLEDYGRYSGFYLNPNSMGFICLMGYGLTFALNNKKLKLFGQILFTIMGLLTFSRTFLLTWFIFNIIASFLNVKNIKIFLYGFGIILILLSYNEFLPVKNPRIEKLNALLSGESVNSAGLNEESRTETWALYYDYVFAKPFFGHGFNAFGGHGVAGRIGAHNTYLKIVGESGILPLLFFLVFLISLLFKSVLLAIKSPYILLMLIGLTLYLATYHNFFETGYILFILLWISNRSEIEFAIQTNENQLN